MSEPTEGWAYPTVAATKAHYFAGPDRRSLCGRYALVIMLPGEQVTPDTGTTTDRDCVACTRKLEARRAKS